MAKYTVSMVAKTKREADKKAKKAREDGYGATVTKVDGGYLIRRTARPLKKPRR